MSEFAEVHAPSFGALLGRGILVTILGILMIVFTFASILVADMLTAVLMIFLGISILTAGPAFFGIEKRTWWMIVLGILVIIGGILGILFPVMFTVYLVYLVAFSALIGGVTDLVIAFTKKIETANRVLSGITGVLGILLGILFLAQPLISAFTILDVSGMFLVAFGIVAIIEAFVARSSAKKA